MAAGEIAAVAVGVFTILGGLWKLAGNTISLQRDQIEALQDWKAEAEDRIKQLETEVEVFKNVPLKEMAQSISDIVTAQATIVTTQQTIIELISKGGLRFGQADRRA